MTSISNPFEFRIIFNLNNSNSDQKFSFVVRTDGQKHEIAFAAGMDPDSMLAMSQAVGARFAAAMRGRWRTRPGTLLDGITYNMMNVHEEGAGIRCSDEDAARIEIAKILRKNDPLINSPLKFSSVVLPTALFEKATFTPENLEVPQDLYCQWSVDDGQAVFLIFRTEEADYWRLNGEWIELREDDDYELDLESTSTIYVASAFIEVWDRYEKKDLPLMVDEIRQYESVPYDPALD
jgi:hypothetical protein